MNVTTKSRTVYSEATRRSESNVLPIKLSETPNGYPRIDVDPPYELFGEFLRAEHRVERAIRLLEATVQVTSGEREHFFAWQDYATLDLDHPSKTAVVEGDFYGAGVPVKSIMPLDQFAVVVEAWAHFVRDR